MSIFQLVQTLYWLALSTWFGGVLFIALAAPVIFRTIRQANPILPTILSVNLENQHGALLSGSIVGNLLRMLSPLQLGCAVVILLTLICQWLIMDRSWMNVWHGAIRSTMFVGAVTLVVYDRRLVWPKAWKFRQEYIDHADEPDVANAAKEQFDHYHRESVRVLLITLALLSLMIVFSSSIMPGR